MAVYRNRVTGTVAAVSDSIEMSGDWEPLVPVAEVEDEAPAAAEVEDEAPAAAEVEDEPKPAAKTTAKKAR